MSDATDQAAEETPPKIWPEAPPEDGAIYQVTDDHKVKMVAMTAATWQKFAARLNYIDSRLRMAAAEIQAMKSGVHPEGLRIVLPE